MSCEAVNYTLGIMNPEKLGFFFSTYEEACFGLHEIAIVCTQFMVYKTVL